MRGSTSWEKGGRNAAFFLFLSAVAVLGFGGSLQAPLAVLRTGVFGTAVWYLWRKRGEAAVLSAYPLLVGGFVLLTIGHAFSSIYFWVSFQHAMNVALAAVLLAWAVLLFRRGPRKMWDATFLAVTSLALAEIGIALFQHFSLGEIRPRGTFDNANYLSEFLVAASILCCARWLWSSGTRGHRFAVLSGGIIFFVAAMTLARSRGVFLASAPAFGVLLIGRFGLRKGGAVLAGVGIPALGLLGFRVAERFFLPDLYHYSRWIIWKSALRTFLDHPFGVGLGGFKYYWFATQSPVPGAFRQYGKFAATTHNEYLEILAGLGAIGLLLFLAVLAYPLVLAVRYRNTIPFDREETAAGAAAVLVLSGLNAMVNSNFHVFGVFFLDAVMLGALYSCLPRETMATMTLPSWAHRMGIPVCVLLFAAAVSTAIGAYAFDLGERFLRSGDLPGAERAFRMAAAADPFRAAYPDALSAVHFQRFRKEDPRRNHDGAIPGSISASLLWEDRARRLNPGEIQYPLRLSYLSLELFRLRGKPSDAMLALRFADVANKLNPYGVEALWNMADVLEALGRREESEKELETAVSVEPNFCRGYARLADLNRGADPVRASRWAGIAQECRGKAATLRLEEHEKWLVEPPEQR